MDGLFGGGGGGTQTVYQTSDPWSGQQPYMKEIYKGAQDLYSSGAGPSFFPGQTYVNFDPATSSALSGMQGMAAGGSPLREGVLGTAQGLLGSGGIQAGAQMGLDPLRSVISGDASIGTGADYRGLLSRMQGTQPINEYLESSARGDYLDGNPHFMDRVNRQASELAGDIGEMFSGAGRYGSGAHQGVVGEKVGDFRRAAMESDYNRERGLQVDAAKAIQSASQGLLGQQLGAISGLTGVEGANIANAVNAGRGLLADMNTGTDQMMRIAALSPSLNAERFADLERLMGVGAMREGKAAEALNEQIARHEFEAMEPWKKLQLYQSAIGGFGDPGGTTTSTTPSQSGGAAGLLGGALGGATVGNMINPAYTGYGALGGGLLGLFA